MLFERNSMTPHFSMEELREIYAAAGSKKTTETMKIAAQKLYPGRDPICYENMFVLDGPGRAFKHNGDQYVNPKCVIHAHPLIIGVMKDDTFYQF